MLNISQYSITEKLDPSAYKTFSYIHKLGTHVKVTKLILIVMVLVLLILMLPWTQNVQGEGMVTTLSPEHRPQTIQSIISGRIDKWYKQEGAYVSKGDTILSIVEIQDAFFDPDLIPRMAEQIKARQGGLDANVSRIDALRDQIVALEKTRDIKLEQIINKIRQAELKVNSDSIRFKASQTEMEIARVQLGRYENLEKNGVVSMTDLEGRKIRVQEAEARTISAENSLLISKNEYLNAQADLLGTKNEFADRIARTQAELYNAIQAKYGVDADLERMRNQLTNFEVRSNYRYILAPQDGYIAQALVTGIGENVKEGQPLVSIMPAHYELAVAFWIRPIDLPLIKVGYPVRFLFDGWPAFVFSGWPQASFGTFGGKIAAIDNFTDENNLYRVLVAPDPEDEPWPKELRVGSGAKGFALLGDVPIWFELWRQLNGFPPDYYTKKDEQKEIKRKEPLRSFK
jgi:membrane fusion protein, adhesin transport system